jgi:hypothetical protein
LVHRGIAPRHFGQIVIMYASALLRSPLCLLERVRIARRVSQATFDPPPVIIIGHWRSGTTHLHNLMSRDPAFFYPTIADSIRPFDFFPGPVEKIWRRILLRLIPSQRPMDGMLLRADLPQEDELALAVMGAPSFLNCFFFPGEMHEIFRREVLLDDPPQGLADFFESLRYYLAKLAVLNPGRRLLLKNPSHSARISKLRALFPGAKFVHIHRDPLEVLRSTRKLYRIVLPMMALQAYDEAAVERHLVSAYSLLMDRLVAGAAGLPPNDFAEIRYTDLVRDPLATLKATYDRIGLDGFVRARPAIADFARAQNHQSAETTASDRAFVDAHSERLAPYRERLGYLDR